jgi:hypothetical protein
MSAKSLPVGQSRIARDSYPFRTAPEGSFSSVAVEGLLTSSAPANEAGLVPATAAFDEDPIALKTGFFFGAPEAEALSDIDWISLLDCECLGLSWPPVSLVSCFISLRRWFGVLLVSVGCLV